MEKKDESISTGEIDVTPEMVEAGVRELSGYYLEIIDGIEPLEPIVRTVFAAMMAAR